MVSKQVLLLKAVSLQLTCDSWRQVPLRACAAMIKRASKNDAARTIAWEHQQIQMIFEVFPPPLRVCNGCVYPYTACCVHIGMRYARAVQALNPPKKNEGAM